MSIIIIIIIIIIFIKCNSVVTRWQWLFYMETKYETRPGSSVGIVTDYGLDGPGSNPGGDEIFRPSRPALWSTQPLVQWVLGISWG